MHPTIEVIKDKTQTYQQKLVSLAHLGEDTAEPLALSAVVKKFLKGGQICNLYEGNAPYRPRYVVPDYERFMLRGSEFLGLKPPKDIWEATNYLLMLYRHIPSITSFPVYVGDIDKLLEPYIADESEAKKAISLFLLQIDRTINDSFCHADLGPEETLAGRLILEASMEQNNAIPNISLKYDPEKTSDGFAMLAVSSALTCAKPSFANDRMFRSEFKAMGYDDYAIASCYNGLPKGGGSCTLVRLNLAKAATLAKSQEEFLTAVLPDIVTAQLSYMDERVRFLAEESTFFESSFLIKEGLIKKERFTAMFGLVGLAEAANSLSSGRFGQGGEADTFAYSIIEKIEKLVKAHVCPYLVANGGRYLLHAQVGIDSDKNVSPGCRIPIGEEPELLDHIIRSSPYHKFFPSGIGDVFAFEPGAKRNPAYLLDIVKGAVKQGLRYMSFYSSDSDVVRITGYLVKRSEIERLKNGEASLQDTTLLGKNAVEGLGVLNRRLRS